MLRLELVEKQQDLNHKEKLLKIGRVVNDAKKHALKKEERTKFIGSFAQAKNLIEKQMKIGQHLKHQKRMRTDCRKKVNAVVHARTNDQYAVPVKAKLFGGFETPDHDASTALSGMDS